MSHRQQGSIFKAAERLADGTVRTSPNWSIKYRTLEGKQKKEAIGPNKKEAAAVLAERLAALHTGTYTELKKDILFGTFAQQWINGFTKKPSTRHGYEALLGCYKVDQAQAAEAPRIGRRQRGGKAHQLVPYFGARPLRSIDVPAMNAYLADPAVQQLKPKTRHNVIVLMVTVLNAAVEARYLGRNPLVAKKSLQRPDLDAPEVEVLGVDELHRLLDAVPPDYYPLFLTAVSTGCRLGELLALQWGDLDTTEQTVHVRRSVYRGEFGKPKSKKSIRRIDLGDQLVGVLTRLRRDRYGKTAAPATDLLFPGADGQPLDPDNLRHRIWGPSLAKAKLRDVKIHSLRHTFASLLIQAGEDLKYISEQMGHASITITVDRYGHLLPGRKRTAQAKLETWLHPAPSATPAVATR